MSKFNVQTLVVAIDANFRRLFDANCAARKVVLFRLTFKYFKSARRRAARANRRWAAPPLVNLTAARVELKRRSDERGKSPSCVGLRVMSWINIYIYMNDINVLNQNTRVFVGCPRHVWSRSSGYFFMLDEGDDDCFHGDKPRPL